MDGGSQYGKPCGQRCGKIKTAWQHNDISPLSDNDATGGAVRRIARKPGTCPGA